MTDTSFSIDISDPESLRAGLQTITDLASKGAEVQTTAISLCIVLSALVQSKRPIFKSDVISALELTASAVPGNQLAGILAQALRGEFGHEPPQAPSRAHLRLVPPSPGAPGF